MIALPSGLKNMCRGPSELKDSVNTEFPPTKGIGGEPTRVAATQNALLAPEALCPRVLPEVGMARRPRTVLR